MNTKNNTGKKLSEEMEGNRLSLYIILAFVCLVGLVFLYRAVESVTHISFFNTCVRWLIWLSVALVAVSAWRVAASRGKDVSSMLLTPGTGLFLSVLALLSSLFLKMFYSDAIKLLYILLPGLCVVYLIKLIYANGFFPAAGFLLLAASLLYVFDRLLLWGLFASWKLPFGLILALLGAAFALLCLRCTKNDGVLRIGSLERQFFKKSETCVPAVLAGVAVMVVGGVFVKSPSYAVFYGLMGLGCLAVALGLYYTYRLMYH